MPAFAEAAIAFRIVGTLIGSYFGGPIGGMVGGMIGGIIGGLIFPEDPNVVEGPRLQDKTVQSATFGAHKIWLKGADRLPGQIIFSSDIKETPHKTKVGGKGLGGPGTINVSFTYSVDIMLAFCQRATGIKRLWADTKLIYDVSEDPEIVKQFQKPGRAFTVRDGNESQLPSALEESYHGAGMVSAHRGLFCIEFADLQLADFANRIPNFTAEVFTDGSFGFQKIASYVAPDPPNTWWMASWGHMDSFGEVWALYYPFAQMFPYPGYAHIFHWTLDRPTDPIDEFNLLWSGTVVQGASIASPLRVRSHEHSAAVFGTNDSNISFSYFQLESGTRIDILNSEATGYAAPEIVAKDENGFYVIYTSGIIGAHLIKFNLTGTQLAESDVITDTTGNANYSDLGVSEGFLWILCGSLLLKVDKDDLSLISAIDLFPIISPIAMTVISDSEIRFFSAVQSTFWVMTNEGTPTVDKVGTDAGYAGNRGFPRWSLRYINGIYEVDFGGFVGGFGAFIDFWGTASVSDDVPLWKYVRDISMMAGLDSVIETTPPQEGDIRVDELTDLVHGFSITRGMSARDALVQLVQTYFFDCRERDLKLDYIKRGHAPVLQIPSADMAARSSLTEQLPDRLTQVMARESELPDRIHVIFNNYLASYQPGHEYAPREVTESRSTITVEIAVAINPDTARRIAYVHLATKWLERDSYSFRLSRRYLPLDAADNVEVVITED